jgi:hypothetical protein
MMDKCGILQISYRERERERETSIAAVYGDISQH